MPQNTSPLQRSQNSDRDIHALRIGIDIGGTFTDFVIFDPRSGEIQTYKVLSTPADPAQAVLDGLAALDSEKGSAQNPMRPRRAIVHGTTVATNALLEGKGAKVALITTRGFRDVIQIGRQNRPTLYDLNVKLPPSLVPDRLRLEITERVGRNGEVLIPIDQDEINAFVEQLKTEKVSSAAVCLLFSFLHPEHEQLIAEKLRQAGISVSLSSKILPEYREYERTSTTVINAYVSPVLDRYLSELEDALSRPAGPANSTKQVKTTFRVMQSNGGIISVQEARRNGVRCILSGPAGGIMAARYIARLVAKSSGSESTQKIKVITFDMGGTSTDVSLIDGEPQVTTEAGLNGHPIRIPILDIHTIGAGGGSIASTDLAGVLNVGPQSAGADPGPACYGRSTLPTVTDANLLLGRLDPSAFLGGRMPLDVQRSHQALEDLGRSIGLDAFQTALGVIEIANAHMERALRVISIERGYDPNDFSLLSFGGAGGLHAADLARRLGIRRVIIPKMASTLSAFGMLTADVVKDYVQTVMLSASVPPEEIAAAMNPLEALGVAQVAAEGIPAEELILERMLDMRYVGQSYELIIPWEPSENQRHTIEHFHAAHLKTYGYERREVPLEIVNVRLRVTGLVPSPQIPEIPLASEDPSPALIGWRDVIIVRGKIEQVPFYVSERLPLGSRISGPAVILCPDTTVLAEVGGVVSVDGFGNFLMDIDYAN
jgi:N-methylhydantoinase A